MNDVIDPLVAQIASKQSISAKGNQPVHRHRGSQGSQSGEIVRELLVGKEMPTSYGFRSPISRSEATSPHPVRPTFDTELLRIYMRKLLQTTLQHAIWSSDREKVKSWMKYIKERVKDRMIEIQPSGL